MVAPAGNYCVLSCLFSDTYNGGESGIRTHGRVSPTHAFQACSFNHSDISPHFESTTYERSASNYRTRAHRLTANPRSRPAYRIARRREGVAERARWGHRLIQNVVVSSKKCRS